MATEIRNTRTGLFIVLMAILVLSCSGLAGFMSYRAGSMSRDIDVALAEAKTQRQQDLASALTARDDFCKNTGTDAVFCRVDSETEDTYIVLFNGHGDVYYDWDDEDQIVQGMH